MADEPGTALAADKGTSSEAEAAAAAEAATVADAVKAAEAAAGKTEGDKAKDGNAEAAKLHGAPEKYGDFTMPEGIEADKALIESAVPVFKELNLSQEGAQKLVDFHSSQLKAAAEASDKHWSDTVEGWEKSTKEDAEIGGAKYDTALADGKKAVGAFFKKPEEAQAWSDFVNTTGVGNHPVLRKLLARIGATIKEDKVNGGGTASEGQRSTAEKLFPKAAAEMGKST